jgi:N-acetylmuramate 1-kinase
MELAYRNLPQALMEDVARELALWAKPGQSLLLSGDVGAGKSTFARAFIKALSSDQTIDIPSPSFALLQAYDATRVPVAHIDLYRLKEPEEADELGIAELLDRHVIVIEWPERLAGLPAGDRLDITIDGHGASRNVTLAAHGAWPKLLERNALAQDFLATSTFAKAHRSFFEGDASSRRYELLEQAGERALLMDMPRRPDGPAVKNGLPYSAIAHLAESIDAVLAINSHLTSLGYSAPRIVAHERAQGFAVIEHLGVEVFGKMLVRGEDMRAPIMTAVELLADMAIQSWPPRVALEGGGTHVIPPYDMDALLIEADLLPSWYWPHSRGDAPTPQALEDFAGIWRELLGDVTSASRIWTLRDFHSPNLLWLPERQGLARVGLIDTQDCVIGHAAYDLASLIQDARVDIPRELAEQAVMRYCELRSAHPEFDRESFLRAYAILGAQRATKILGIFARLNKRDGKPHYLKHLPRMRAHLARNLRHPGLARLASWYAKNLGLVHDA